MSSFKKMTPEEFKSFIDKIFTGDPADARSDCESAITPNYIRFMAGGDETNFERAVEKVAFFRANCQTWESDIVFFVQEDNRVAARLLCTLGMAGQEAKRMELMFMAEVDGEGLFEKVWEQAADWVGE